ncbi:deoxyhypusine synthase [Angomonas deanei]|nr:deoxyhypusine synthase [Angomonas deanei]|eukprot:EPY36507.1 deoxyhypusine synthase [Angomonas deanei]
MTDTAAGAVLVHSTKSRPDLPQVRGPTPEVDASTLLDTYETIGYQATNVHRAMCIARKMLQPQKKSKIFTVQNEQFVEVPPAEEDAEALVYSNLFLGVTANAMGTGCRDAVRFLVKHGVKPRVFDPAGLPLQEDEQDRLRQLWSPDIMECRQAALAEAFPSLHANEKDRAQCPLPYRSFLSAVVLSGGGPEHDIRRLCADIEGPPHGYRLTHYASEPPSATEGETNEREEAQKGKFGNVSYGGAKNGLFDSFMAKLSEKLVSRQATLQAQHRQKPGTVCSWAVSPAEVWCLAGLWMKELLVQCRPPTTEEAAWRSLVTAHVGHSVLYWAALQGVPVYGPSLADGDLADYLLRGSGRLQLDLVRDIHSLNKFAMQSLHSSIIVCGGGVVKHHLCNANLMRNGADLSIFINNGMEFDGSDGGAKPEEALSWGKIRIDGEYVKLYSEISVVLPLLVAKGVCARHP